MRRLFLILPAVIVLALTCSGCDPKQPAKPSKPAFGGNITSYFEAGGIFTFDRVTFWNKSGKPLSEVKVLIILSGVDGRHGSVYQYWAKWDDGDDKIVLIPGDQSVRDVQRIEMRGECNEGNIDIYWTPKQRK